jgi:hypothetical protein
MDEDDEMDDILKRELEGVGEVENIENSIELSNKKANE